MTKSPVMANIKLLNYRLFTDGTSNIPDRFVCNLEVMWLIGS